MTRIGSLARRHALGLVASCYVIALLQRPGDTVADTRLELSVDPGLFLSRVTHLWSGTTDLGHVQSGQFNGYLFPMGPWFAGGSALGVPMWLVQRLWLGTLLALAAYGLVKLLRELMPGRALAHFGAAALFVLNPYVVQFASRGTVALISYAALPWLLLAAYRGVRRPLGWRWPAIVALILAASGGGVNAALIAFMLLGPVALVAYDIFTGVVSWRPAMSFAWRACLLGLLASSWWAIPVLLQSKYGADFLSFTEQPGTIWATTSVSEGLRELGFWGMYVGVGYGRQQPFLSTARYYLFNPAVILACFAVPLLAFAALRNARAWRYAPFFGLLAALTLVIMAAGYPEGTPLRHALNFAYSNVPAGRFLRTTYKAAPLLVLSFACLGGSAAAALFERLRAGMVRIRGLRVPAWSAVGLGVIPALAGLPLLLGTAIDRAQVYHLPNAWKRALDDATAAAGADARAAVAPGEIFGWYRWGGTMDPIGPALERKPVAIREVVPYADQRSAQLQTVVDDLVQQDRLTRGQLLALLQLMGVRQLVVPTDTRPLRSGALAPVGAAVALAREPALAHPVERYGPARAFAPPAGRTGPQLSLPQLRRYRLPGAPVMVRIHPRSGVTVLDGDADGITTMAALGVLDPSKALFYAADVTTPAMRQMVQTGARLIISDSARLRAVVSSRTRLNRGPTLTESAPLKSDFSRYAPFGDRPDARTVAEYSTLEKLYAPALPAFKQFPERRAYAVFDGRRDTTWVADPVLDPDKRYVEATLRRPLHVGYIEVFPHVDRLGGTTRVEVTFNGGHRREIAVSPAGTRVPVPVSGLRSVRVRIAKTYHSGRKPVVGGLDEVRIPGLRVDERLRLPTVLSTATRGLDLSHDELDVVFERTTSDFPRRTGRRVGPVQDSSPLDTVDAEPGIQRRVELPAARAFVPSGLASVSPTAPDDAIDRLTGMPPSWRMWSSSRFEGVPGRRASSAFDRDPATAWIGDLRTPWLAWRSPGPITLRTLTLVPGPADYARPRLVRVSSGTGSALARVRAGGLVDLGTPLSGRAFRIDVLSTTRGARLRAVAVAEVRAAGVRPPAARRRGRFSTRCGALSVRAVAARPSSMVVSGTVRDLDAGESLALHACGAPLRLPRGSSLVGAPPGVVVRPDRLLLRSAAPRPPVVAAALPGRVQSVSGEGPLGLPDHARLEVRSPAWLVYGQSWSTGWRARCRSASGVSRDLGAPQPIDGFANGWPVPRGCVEASFSFPPQRVALAGYGVSAIAAVAALALALLGWRREHRPPAAAASPPRPQVPEHVAAGSVRLGWRGALVGAAGIGIVCGFVFALRAGVVLAPLALVALGRGIDARRLLRLALTAVAALPLIYLVVSPKNRGGYSFTYPTDLLGAHWVAVLGLVSMTAAAALMAADWRRSGLDRVDHAVPSDELAQQRDLHEESEARPVARLDGENA